MSTARFLPALPVVLAWVLWAHNSGGYFPRSWYPGALGGLVLLAGMALAGRRAVPRSRAVALALALLAGLVAWSYLSLLWSDAPGDGLTSSNKLLVLLLGAWVLALLPWTPRSAATLLMLWVAGVTAVCAISLVEAHGTDRIGDFFIEGRYLDPIGYANGVAALPAMALFGALVLASRRSTPLLVRPLLVGASVLLLEFTILPQSRGSLIGLIVAFPLFVLLAPERLRLVLPALAVAGCTLLALDQILDVYDVATLATVGIENPPPVGPVVDSAAEAMAWTSLLGVGAGGVLVLLDRTVRPGPAGERRLRLGGTVAVVLCALAGVGVAAVNAGSIWDKLDETWHTFRYGGDEDQVATPGQRFTTVYGDQRYDYFSVAFEAFEDRPLTGIGAGAYERRFTRDREGEKPSRYAHDFWLRILGELGLVGFLLLIGFLVAGPGRAAWQRRRAGPEQAAVVAACVCASAYFFVHASFDWLDEFPALAGPAFALPLVALSLVAAVEEAEAPAAQRVAARRWRRPVLAVLGVVGLLAAALAVVPAYVAARYDDRAAAAWTDKPQLAFHDLERAADLAPLSARPPLRAATLAVELGRLDEARDHFAESLEREDTWYGHLGLGMIASIQGKKALARREIRIAYGLNREDPFVSEAFHRVRRGRKVDPATFNRDVEELNRDRFTHPDN
jgi:hypothetical protein